MTLAHRLDRLAATARSRVRLAPWDAAYERPEALCEALLVDWRAALGGQPAPELDLADPESRRFVQWALQLRDTKPDAESVVVELALKALTREERALLARLDRPGVRLSQI